MVVLVLLTVGIAAAKSQSIITINSVGLQEVEMEEKEVKLTRTSDSISSKSTITGACEGTWGVGTCPISTAVISCLIQTLIDIYQFIENHISVLLFLFFWFLLPLT